MYMYIEFQFMHLKSACDLHSDAPCYLRIPINLKGFSVNDRGHNILLNWTSTSTPRGKEWMGGRGGWLREARRGRVLQLTLLVPTLFLLIFGF